VSFLKDLIKKIQEDDIFFLAGGLAFNIVLAGVPFFLLLAGGLGYLLGQSVETASETAKSVVNMLLPAGAAQSGESMLDPILNDVVRTRAAAGIGGALGFAWFSTRLFGSLRTVLAMIFERRDHRNFFRGKLWDMYLALSAAVLVTVWVTINTYLVIGTGRLGGALAQVGVLSGVVSGVEYLIARLISIALTGLFFFSLYRWLPQRRTPWRIALIGGLVAASLFELARWGFALLTQRVDMTSLYTGTLAALVIVVFWVYYGAVIFLLGAESAHAAEKALAPVETP